MVEEDCSNLMRSVVSVLNVLVAASHTIQPKLTGYGKGKVGLFNLASTWSYHPLWPPTFPALQSKWQALIDWRMQFICLEYISSLFGRHRLKQMCIWNKHVERDVYLEGTGWNKCVFGRDRLKRNLIPNHTAETAGVATSLAPRSPTYNIRCFLFYRQSWVTYKCDPSATEPTIVALGEQYLGSYVRVYRHALSGKAWVSSNSVSYVCVYHELSRKS